MKLTSEKKTLVNALIEEFNSKVVTRKEVETFIKDKNLPRPRWLYNTKEFRESRATYNLQKVLDLSTPATTKTSKATEDATVAAAAIASAADADTAGKTA